MSTTSPCKWIAMTFAMTFVENPRPRIRSSQPGMYSLNKPTSRTGSNSCGYHTHRHPLSFWTASFSGTLVWQLLSPWELWQSKVWVYKHGQDSADTAIPANRTDQRRHTSDKVPVIFQAQAPNPLQVWFGYTYHKVLSLSRKLQQQPNELTWVTSPPPISGDFLCLWSLLLFLWICSSLCFLTFLPFLGHFGWFQCVNICYMLQITNSIHVTLCRIRHVIFRCFLRDYDMFLNFLSNIHVLLKNVFFKEHILLKSIHRETTYYVQRHIMLYDI